MSGSKKTRLSLEELQRLQRNPEAIAGRIVDILNMLTDEDEEVRAWATDCLQEVDHVGPGEAVRIAGLLDHPNAVVVNWACKTLAKAANIRQFQGQLASLREHHPSVGVQRSAELALAGIDAGMKVEG